MGTKLSNWLRRISTGWVALIALAIFVLFTALVLPGQSAQADAAGASVKRNRQRRRLRRRPSGVIMRRSAKRPARRRA